MGDGGHFERQKCFMSFKNAIEHLLKEKLSAVKNNMEKVIDSLSHCLRSAQDLALWKSLRKQTEKRVRHCRKNSISPTE